MFDFSSSPLLTLRTPGERRFRLLFDVLILWAIAILGPFLVAIIPGAFATFVIGGNAMMKVVNDAFSSGLSGGSGTIDSDAYRAVSEQITESAGYRIAELFGQAWIIALSIFVCLVIQRRSLATMGIEKRGAAKHYGLGLVFGVLLSAATVLIACLSRAATFEGFDGGSGVLLPLFVLVGYLIQGAAEEILFHGFFMTTLARRFRWLPSVLVSALFFSFLHAVNAGVTLLSLLNVFLFGVFLGLLTIRTGSVIGACALHAAWNVTEGLVFGCSVSGFPAISGLFRVTSDASRSVTNGGAFGPEGGLAATMVLMIALIAVLFLPPFGKKRQPTP